MAAAPWLPELLRARGPRRLAFALACAIAGRRRGAAARCTSPSQHGAAPGAFAELRHRSRCCRSALAASARAWRSPRCRVRDGWLAYAGHARRGAWPDRRFRRVPAHRRRALRTRVHGARRAGERRHRRTRRSSARRSSTCCSCSVRASISATHAGARRRARRTTRRRGSPTSPRRGTADRSGKTRELCFKARRPPDLGKANRQHWFLVTGGPTRRCAARGDLAQLPDSTFRRMSSINTAS